MECLVKCAPHILLIRCCNIHKVCSRIRVASWCESSCMRIFNGAYLSCHQQLYNTVEFI